MILTIPSEPNGRLLDGSLTHALNVQIPLGQDVTMENGATALCPTSHVDEVTLSHRTFTDYANSPLCTGNNRVYGTNNVGDILIYDSRLVHWGSENPSKKTRTILAYSYSHDWWEDHQRPYTPEIKSEERRWKGAWRSDKLMPDGGVVQADRDL